jgi:hypothetical protein
MLGENRLASGLLERGQLQGRRLVAGRNAGVAVLHNRYGVGGFLYRSNMAEVISLFVGHWPRRAPA